MHDPIAAASTGSCCTSWLALTGTSSFRIGQPVWTSLLPSTCGWPRGQGGPRRGEPLPDRAGSWARLEVRAGQYFLLAFPHAATAGGGSHPYSISAAPNGEWLRITVKDLGDGSRDLPRRTRSGTRVIVEGPYGYPVPTSRRIEHYLLLYRWWHRHHAAACPDRGPAGRARRSHPALSREPAVGRPRFRG